MVRTLCKLRELLLNWFLAEGEIPSGTVKGLNNKVKLTMGKWYGFRTENANKLVFLTEFATYTSQHLPTFFAGEDCQKNTVHLF
jgi:hypothetical protein